MQDSARIEEILGITMASSPVSEQNADYLEVSSYVRGYHVYKDYWEPRIGETLLLRREPHNDRDRRAVAVMKEQGIVGHVPQNFAPFLSSFLQREVEQRNGKDYWETRQPRKRLRFRNSLPLLSLWR